MRPSAQHRGYSRKWQLARAAFLKANPYCLMCLQAGMYTPATLVDHIVPHQGDQHLFWNRGNWQPLCATHHSGAKQSQERTGRVRGCDEHGNPFDQGHHWNQP